MNVTIQREQLLKPLKMVIGAVERRQTIPILSNVLLSVRSHEIKITATDLELGLSACIILSESAQPGTTTVAAYKLMDICRLLPDEAKVTLSMDDERKQLVIKSGRSHFSLAILPAEDFPSIDDDSTPGNLEINIKPKVLAKVFANTCFSMAHQDVRYYLNGTLLEFVPGLINAVTTDGHRLAKSSIVDEGINVSQRLILPYKGVSELMRLLSDIDDSDTLTLTASGQFFRVTAKAFTFTSKLIDGQFPDYLAVIPQDCDKVISIEGDILRKALSRVSILSNEKHRGVKLSLSDNCLSITANNPAEETAEEILAIEYTQEPVELGINADYLLDVVSSILSGNKQAVIKLMLTDSNSSMLVMIEQDERSCYVIMPMRL